MKITCLLIVLICHGGRCLQDQFTSIDSMKEIQDIENKIEDFGRKKKSIIDQIKFWQKGASEGKVESIEESIRDLFKENGELAPTVVNRLMRDIGKDKIDPDYKMPHTLLSFAQIEKSFNPLFDFEAKFNEYQARTSKVENELIYSQELNREVGLLIQQLHQQPVFKRALITLLSNIQDRKQAGFDIRKFYFGPEAFSTEELFISKRADKNIEELYILYGQQKSHFLEEQDLLKENYDRLNQLFVQFYTEVLNLQAFYQEKTKTVTLMDSVDVRVLQGIRRMLDTRRAIADIVSLYRSQVMLIQNLRIVFQKIFGTAQRIQQLNLQKKIQEAEITGSEFSIEDITQAEKDEREGLADEAQARKDDLEAQQDARDQAENRRLGQNAVEIKAEYEARAAARAKRAKERAKRAEVRAQRKKDAARKSSELKAKQQSASQVDGVSPESYFKDKEFSDKLDKYAEGIQSKIDDGEISLADVNDTEISERIVAKQLEPLTSNGSSAGRLVISLSLALLAFAIPSL